MDSKRPYCLQKEDLLERLKKVGFEDIAELLTDKNIDGEKLLRLREIDIVSWKLPLSKKKKLFGFIEKYKLNPALLHIRPKPETPKRSQIVSSKPLPAATPNVNVKSIPKVPQRSNGGDMNKTSFETMKSFQPKFQSFIPNYSKKPKSKISEDPELKKYTVENSTEEDYDYIDMNQTFSKKNAFTKPRTTTKPRVVLPPKAPTGKPIIKIPERPIAASLSSLPSRTFPEDPDEVMYENPPQEEIAHINKRLVPLPPVPNKITLDSILSKNQKKARTIIQSTTSDPFPSDDMYEDVNHLDFIKSKENILSSAWKQTPQDQNFLPHEIYESIISDEENRPNSYMDLDTVKLTVSENATEQLEDSSDMVYENLPTDVVKVSLKENDIKCFPKMLRTFFKFPNKSKEQTSSISTPAYENITASQSKCASNTSSMDYDSSYKERPLPEVPSEPTSTAAKDLEKIPSISNLGNRENAIATAKSIPNLHVDSDFDDGYLKPIEDFQEKSQRLKSTSLEKIPQRPSDLIAKQFEGWRNKPPMSISEKISPAININLAAQLQKKLAEMKCEQKKTIPTISTDDSDEDEFEDEPVYTNTEDDSSASSKQKPGSYEIHFINSTKSSASKKFQEEDEHPVSNNTEDETSKSLKRIPESYETHFINSANSTPSNKFQEESDEDENDVYVTAVSNITNNRYYRDTTNKGAKQYLEDLDDGAFLFRPSKAYFLVLTVKYKHRYYHLGLEKTTYNKFRLENDEKKCYPEFSNLNEFVRYFSEEAISFQTSGKVIEIILKPLLRPT